MKLEGYREAFYDFSGKLSDITRQLSFAGIAVIWLFKKDISGIPTLPRDLNLPLILLVLTLSFYLRYLVASLIWRHVYRSKEKQGIGEEEETEHSTWVESPIYLIFLIKVILVILSYVSLLRYLIGLNIVQ
jgi:H+/Cl- antiporter ClcA